MEGIQNNLEITRFAVEKILDTFLGQVLILLLIIFRILLLGQFPVESGVYFKYTSNILQVYFQNIFEVYLKYA